MLGYEGRDGKCMETKGKVDVCDLTHIKYHSRDAKNWSPLKGFLLDAALHMTCNSTLVDTSNYKLNLVAKTKSKKFLPKTEVRLKQQGLWDLYIPSITGSETCLALSNIDVTHMCEVKQVETDDGGCSDLKVVASVLSDSLIVILKKKNEHLEGDFSKSKEVIKVRPSAKYNMSFEHHLRSAGRWVKTGDAQPTSDSDLYSKIVPLFFNAAGLNDRTTVIAVLKFVGRSGNVAAIPASISITGVVKAAPLFKYSTFQLPKSVPKGKAVQIVILAFDVNNLQIQEVNGQFFALKVSDRKKNSSFTTTFDSTTAEFHLDVPSQVLQSAGKYSVWVSHAFRHGMKLGLGRLNLPTAEHPATFMVIDTDDSSTIQIISSMIIGVLTVLAFAGIVYYFVKNPHKFKLLIVLFICTPLVLH